MNLLGSLSVGTIVASLIFSGVGLVAFSYGKRMENFRLMGLGAALMVYSYFTPGVAWAVIVGLALTAAVVFSWE